MKKYLFYSFKRKLPLYIIVMVIFLTIALTSFATTSFFADRYYDSYEGVYYSYYGYNSGTLPLLVAYFVILFVLPFFNMVLTTAPKSVIIPIACRWVFCSSCSLSGMRIGS